MGVFQAMTNNILGSASSAILKMKGIADKKEALKQKELQAQLKASQANVRAQEKINAKVNQKEEFKERVQAVKEKKAVLTHEEASKLLSQIKMDRRKMERYKRYLRETKKGVNINAKGKE